MPDQSEAPIVRGLTLIVETDEEAAQVNADALSIGERKTIAEAAEIIRLCEEALTKGRRVIYTLIRFAEDNKDITIPEVRKALDEHIELLAEFDAALAQIKGQNP